MTNQERVYEVIKDTPIGEATMEVLCGALPDLRYSTIGSIIADLKHKGKIQCYRIGSGKTPNKSLYVLSGTPMPGYEEKLLTTEFAAKAKKRTESGTKLQTGAVARTINGTKFDPKNYGPQDVTPVINADIFMDIKADIERGFVARNGEIAVANKPAPKGVPLRILPRHKHLSVGSVK